MKVILTIILIILTIPVIIAIIPIIMFMFLVKYFSPKDSRYLEDIIVPN